MFLATAFPQHIDCVGESITVNGYPEITDFWMVQDGYDWRVHNYGVPGITVSIPGFDYINTQAYQEVMSRKSEHIVVMLGASDRKTVANHGTVGWESDYRLLINKFRSVSKRVFLGTITYQIYSGQNYITDAMNLIIRQIAKDKGLKIIDFNSVLGTDPSNFRSDGVHPSTTGKYKLARLAFDILKTYPIAVLEDMILTLLYDEQTKSLNLSWTDISETGQYQLNKTWFDDSNQPITSWEIFTDNEHSYIDTDMVSLRIYYYGIEAFKDGYWSRRSRTIEFIAPKYLSIEDEEYWDTVKDYEEQRKFGWFGCDHNFTN